MEEENAKKEYVYIDGKWQIPDPEPSERALKAANSGYLNSSKSDQKDIIFDFGHGSDSSKYAIRNWAVYLDGNLEELIRVEALVEQDKSGKNEPATYTTNQSPSSKALQVAAAVFTNLSPSDQEKILKEQNWSSATEAINQAAIVLDNNPAELARVEATLNNFKAGSNNTNNQAPIIQQTYPKHCTSNTIGDYTYTNCY